MVLVLANTLPIVEPIPIPDTICSAGLTLMQDVGFGVRFVVCNQETLYEASADQLVVKGKIILPYARIWPGISMAANFMVCAGARLGARSLKLVRG